jgi:4'-phosphopantetheinyl transferase EntD
LPIIAIFFYCGGLRGILIEVMPSEMQLLSLPGSVVSIIEESPRSRSIDSKLAADLSSLRKSEFELGRSLGHRALTQAGWRADQDGLDWRSTIPKNLDRSPNWPAGFVGSISHSDRWIWVAVSRAEEFASLGIDTEGIVEPQRATELQSSIGRDIEWERLAKLGMAENLAFSLLFSAKESFFKLAYPLIGKFWEFHDLEATGVRLDLVPSDHSSSYAGVIFLRGRSQILDPALLSQPKSTFNPSSASYPIRFQVTDQDVFTFASVRCLDR